jgi:hypothetical protein
MLSTHHFIHPPSIPLIKLHALFHDYSLSLPKYSAENVGYEKIRKAHALEHEKKKRKNKET